MSVPGAAEVEHAEWSALKEYASVLGLNPKGRSAIVRQRVLDHLRRRREEVAWRASREEQAAVLTRLGFADVAVRLWESTISLDTPAPWVGLGAAYEKAGMLGEAVKCFDRAVQMGDVAARLLKAHALVRGGATEAALAELDFAIGARPGEIRAWARLADLHEAEGRRDAAIDAHTRISDLSGSRAGLARGLMKVGRFGEAEAALAAHLAGHPADAVGWNNRGVCLAKLGRWREALEALRTAASLNARDPAVMNNLACVLAAMGKSEEALRKLRVARRLAGEARILRNEAALIERAASTAEKEAKARASAVRPEHPGAIERKPRRARRPSRATRVRAGARRLKKKARERSKVSPTGRRRAKRGRR